MNKLAILSLAFAAGISAAACGGSNSNSNNFNSNRSAMNSASNSIATAANTAANAAANAANSVEKAVDKVTTDDPADFVKAAAQDGNAEIALAKLAAARSKNATVKAFAAKMLADHTAVGNELKELAQKKQWTLPTDNGSAQSTIDDLSKATDTFDKDYVDAMVSDHEDAVSMFQKQADNGKDADLKAWAAKTLPKLKGHLESIKKIQSEMK